MLKVNGRCGPRMTALHPTRCPPQTVRVRERVGAGRGAIPFPQLPTMISVSFSVSNASLSHLPPSFIFLLPRSLVS